jgi:hypothetical protein
LGTDTSVSREGWHVDDVQVLACTGGGDAEIDVDPAELASSQLPDVAVTLPLTISNQGSSDLLWTIAEEPAAGDQGCVSGDISWAGVAPAAGTTLSSTATISDVTLDSAGMATGVYTGTLCVTSNDADEPTTRIPLTLTVLEGAEEGAQLYLPVVVNAAGRAAEAAAALLPLVGGFLLIPILRRRRK